MIALLLEMVLEEMGFAVCAVESTETGAVAAAQRCSPQLMIVDARLRQGSGLRAVQQINCAKFIPHIFASGDMLVQGSLDPRAVILRKPFLESDLALAIQQALGPGRW